MKTQLLFVCLMAYVTSAQGDQPKVTFNLTYVDGNTRPLTFNKKDYSECIYTDRTKNLICAQNHLYFNIVNVWTKLSANVQYVSVNCLRDSGPGKGSGLCVCKSTGTGDLSTEPFTYCHLTSLTMGSFNQTHNIQALDLSDNQLHTVGIRSFIGLDNVKYISLANNRFFTIPFGVFCDTPMLEYLDLSHLSLDVFPSHAFICKEKLDKLEAIDLTNSGIKDVPAESLDYLPSLTSLDLGENQLVEIYKRSFSGGISLQHLNLSNNALRYLFPYFCDYLPKMTSLHLRSNKFSYFQFEEISNCSMVEMLDLSSNQIRYFTGQSSAVVSLKYFNISNNVLLKLNFSMSTSVQLMWFDASFNMITDIHGGVLASNEVLEYFNVSHNNISRSNNFQEIFKNTKALVQLDLSHNQLTSLPANGFQNLRNLTHLHLNHNTLNNLDVHSFSGLMSLEYLMLSNNRLSTLPISIFNELASLRHVSLSFNEITSIEARFWPALEVLSLDNNQISQLSIADFSKMKQLDLSHNRLSKFVGSDENIFVNFENMRDLDLSYNSINDISPRLFDTSKNLETLNLEHNNLNFNITFEFLNSPKNLNALNLAFNKFERIGPVFSNTSLTKLTKFNISNNVLKTLHRLADGMTISNIKTIDMSNCGIINLEQDVFIGLPELEFVDLSNNVIETFPVLIANDHTIYDFTDNPIICACNMSWLMENWIEVSVTERMRISTHNFHVPFCRVYTESELSNPDDLYRRQFMCLETDNCDHRCLCYKTEDAGPIYTVECQNGLSTAPSVLPSTALAVFLDGNSFISNDSLSSFFTLVNMSAKELYLNHSAITTLDSRTFQEFRVLEILSLAHNNLKSLQGKLFVNKVSLREIYLNNNKMSHFEVGVFSNLPSLKEIDLSGNRLVVLSSSTLSELAALRRVMYFFLAGNPWSCNCSNVGFKDFIDDMKFKIMDRRTLYCGGTKQEMLYQTRASFACIDTESTGGNPTTIAVILVVVVILVIVIAALAYFRREVLSLWYYHTGCRIPSQQHLPGTHFDCYLSYDPQDRHCSEYIERTLLPKLRNNGYSTHTSSDVIYDIEVTRRAIEDSQCSLFIIDRNFTSNPFYVKVFQMALERQKCEKRFNVTILILDDIDLMLVQPDVMERLRIGDYVTARSRVWWERLVYELPKPTDPNLTGRDTVSESEAIVFSNLNDDITV